MGMKDPIHNGGPRKPVIAVAGSTGNLGTHLIDALLEPELLAQTGGVIAILRKDVGETERWEKGGAEIRILDNNNNVDELVKLLEGVDVLINAISTSGAKLRHSLVAVLRKTSVKLYFPSEFGIDHTLHDFTHPEWDGKKRHYELSKSILEESDIQVCRFFMGMFLHTGIGPWYGFHTSKGVYQSVGDGNQTVSYTDVNDVAKIVVNLSQKAVAGEKVPQELRVAGTHATMNEVAKIMSDAGGGEIEVRGADLDEFREKQLNRDYDDRSAVTYLRFLMGDGRIDYRPKELGGLGNDNEVVNPGETLFKWKTIQDYARETKGRPNADC